GARRRGGDGGWPSTRTSTWRRPRRGGGWWAGGRARAPGRGGRRRGWPAFWGGGRPPSTRLGGRPPRPPRPRLPRARGATPPACVNLVTTDWDLERDAVPGTLVDLAARHYVDIDMVGDDTFVQVRSRGGRGALTGYEEMVLDHVRDLAGSTPEGRVPAQAL